MNDNEVLEVLQYLQTAMRRAGFEELNSRVVSDLRHDPGSPRAQLARYLDALSLELRLGTQAGVRTAVDGLNEIVQTESGRRIDGIRVQFSIEDQRLFGLDSLDLGVGRDLESVIADLEELLEDINESDR